MTVSAWPPDLARVRALVLAHGWNATSYQLVNPGIRHWFAPEGDAVVGWVRAAGARTRVVAGAPVCAEHRLPAVTAAFAADARAAGDRVCYFGAEARLERLFARSPGHRLLRLGAQPAWDPAAWAGIVRTHASLRAQLHRARNKGVRVEEWPATRAQADPALRAVLSAWLAGRGLPPLHFLVEPDTLARLDDRRCFVADRDGAVVAYLVASPVRARGGWLVEQVVRAPDAPNGTSELLVDACWRTVAAEGAAYVTLGLAPLARPGALGHDAAPPPPAWARALLWWMRAHGRRFYDFAGLERFKTKFAPMRWEPVYAVLDGPRVTPRALRAVTEAFTGRPVLHATAVALARAARTEVRRLRARAGAR